jgi:TonB family protein
MRLPKVIYSFQPTMPPEAKAAGVRGPVILSAVIGQDGKITKVRVIKSVPELDDIAMAAFTQWRYEPPAPGADGKPRMVTVTASLPGQEAVSPPTMAQSKASADSFTPRYNSFA